MILDLLSDTDVLSLSVTSRQFLEIGMKRLMKMTGSRQVGIWAGKRTGFYEFHNEWKEIDPFPLLLVSEYDREIFMRQGPPRTKLTSVINWLWESSSPPACRTTLDLLSLDPANIPLLHNILWDVRYPRWLRDHIDRALQSWSSFSRSLFFLNEPYVARNLNKKQYLDLGNLGRSTMTAFALTIEEENLELGRLELLRQLVSYIAVTKFGLRDYDGPSKIIECPWVGDRIDIVRKSTMMKEEEEWVDWMELDEILDLPSNRAPAFWKPL
ncbi:hypothetical protein ABW19_dt0203197 [Dactylella cylindrospora]|nr:hypothetical protein ABW19_dt0203197 [Dactylella cylindrospora]